MKNPIRMFRNIILPAIILIPLIGIMVGCIYIPTRDHTLLVGTKKDFRKWADDHKTSKAPALAGITRCSIESMFGKPVFLSKNDRCVAYVMGSENGIEIWPLCFGGGFVDGKTHVLKIVYDENDRLKRVVALSDERWPPVYWFGMDMMRSNGNTGSMGTANPLPLAQYLLRQANKDCPNDEVIENLSKYPDLIGTTEPASQP